MKTPRKMFLVKFWDFENFRLFDFLGHFRPKINFSKKIFFWCRVGIFWRSFSSSSGQNTRKTYIYVPRKKLSLKISSKGRFLLVFLRTKPPFLWGHFYIVFSFSDAVFFTIRFLRLYFMIFKRFWDDFSLQNLTFENPWRSLQ